jgi:hypothetical protein
MVARNQNRIRCIVVSVPVTPDRINNRGALSREVLPWADPYVAGLIKKLQDEVRAERLHQSLVRSYTLNNDDDTSGLTREAPGYAGGFTARGAAVAESWDDTSDDDMLFAQ